MTETLPNSHRGEDTRNKMVTCDAFGQPSVTVSPNAFSRCVDHEGGTGDYPVTALSGAI